MQWASSTRLSATKRLDQTTGEYAGLIYAKAAPEILSPQGLLVRADIAKQQVPRVPTAPSCPVPGGDGSPGPAAPAPGAPGPSPTLPTPIKPRRFDGSVEIDINRLVKAFDTPVLGRDGIAAKPRREGEADTGD